MKGNKGLRMCVVCHQHKNKSELLRLCKDNNNNHVFIDFNSMFQSRGFYICKDKNCINKFVENKFTERLFGKAEKSSFIDMLRSIAGDS